MSVVIEAADLFAGSGGTWTGLELAVAALGGTVNGIAVNHWPVAVATHSANHPHVAHYCMDLQEVEPDQMVPGRRLDLLVASPECTHFSRARGGKPVSDQRRSGADWVLRWLKRLDVRCLLIENVEEFMSWGDVDEKGRPVSKKRGRHFVAWLKKLAALGYRYDYQILNAADYGDVTTRKRFFLIARKDGRPIRWPEPTHRKPSRDPAAARFDALPPWRAAAEIIDWSDLGPSLFDRTEPLSVNTRLRIARGLQKFGGILAPLYIRLLDLPAEDQEQMIARCTGELAEAFTTSQFNGRGHLGCRPVGEPLTTVTTVARIGLATPTLAPFVFANRNNAVPVGPDAPLPTITTATGGSQYLVTPAAEPFVIGQQSDSAARPVDQPIMAVTTGGVIRLFSPTVSPFLDVFYGTGAADSIDEPLSTATTKPRHALVSPLAQPVASFLTPGFAERAGQLPRVHALDAPLPTIAATGHLHLATATIEQVAGQVDPRRLVVVDGVLCLLDIRYRMLKNSELAAAMGFPPGYQFHGTKTDVTRQIGNAVPVNTAAALIGAILDAEPVAVREVAS